MNYKSSLFLVLTFIITSCGGGGGGGGSSTPTPPTPPANNAPTFANVGTIAVAENVTAIGTVTATDADGDTLTYSLTGDDASLISISSSTGELTFNTAPDFENPGSASGDNNYSITVVASDGSATGSVGVVVSVTDVDENSAPVITSSNSFTAAENQTAIGTVTATDADGDSITFQVSGSELAITSAGVLTFASAPDYETKTSYNITINVDDSSIGATPDATVNYLLTVIDVAVETTPAATVSITEVASWSSSTTSVAADWFEITNYGTTALDITGWKVDDNSNLFTAALPLTGITSIAPGQSVIFLETSATNAATIIANFKSTWFGINPPANLQVGSYTGASIGLSSSGDAVNLYDANGNLKANVVFGAATTNYSFNNAAGLNNATITLLSQIGVNGAFAAINDLPQIGSPGNVGKLIISEVAPWASSNSPVAADWFELTNTKAIALNITGWKVDDNSQSPVAAVALLC